MDASARPGRRIANDRIVQEQGVGLVPAGHPSTPVQRAVRRNDVVDENGLRAVVRKHPAPDPREEPRVSGPIPGDQIPDDDGIAAIEARDPTAQERAVPGDDVVHQAARHRRAKVHAAAGPALAASDREPRDRHVVDPLEEDDAARPAGIEDGAAGPVAAQ